MSRCSNNNRLLQKCYMTVSIVLMINSQKAIVGFSYFNKNFGCAHLKQSVLDSTKGTKNRRVLEAQIAPWPFNRELEFSFDH